MYFFQGEVGESLDTPNAFYVPGSSQSVPFGLFLQYFPSSANIHGGKLHFRFRVDDARLGYVWRDVRSPQEILPLYRDQIVAKVLCLDPKVTFSRTARLRRKGNVDFGAEGLVAAKAGARSLAGPSPYSDKPHNGRPYSDSPYNNSSRSSSSSSSSRSGSSSSSSSGSGSRINGSSSGSNGNGSSSGGDRRPNAASGDFSRPPPFVEAPFIDLLGDGVSYSSEGKGGGGAHDFGSFSSASSGDLVDLLDMDMGPSPRTNTYSQPRVNPYTQPRVAFNVGGSGGFGGSGGVGDLLVGIDISGAAPAAQKLNRVELAARREAGIQEKVNQALEFKQELDENLKRETDELEVAKRKHDGLLTEWAFDQSKKKRNVRTLLTTMHKVLWAGSAWKSIGLGDVIEPKKVKLQFRKAMLVVHPDRCTALTAENRFVGKRVFEAINEAYQEFLKTESVE